jgi:2-methylcitrate dehydratase PrpD
MLGVASQQTAAAALGAFAAGVRADQLPPAVLESVRSVVLCDLACSMAAGEDARPARALAMGLRPAEATMLGDGRRVPIEPAAFANAVAIHARTQDDTHYASQSHAGAAVIPAALAIAERDRVDGRTFVAAVVAGYEVTAAVGELLAEGAIARGFRASSVFGVLGAAAAAARAAGLEDASTAHAISLATNAAGGLNQTWLDGSTDYLYQLGLAARNGVTAARLAAAGESGAMGAIDGAAGFGRAIGGQAALAPVEAWGLGQRFRILEAVYKPSPICNICQSPALLAAQLAASGVDPTRIRALRLYLNPDDRAYPGTLASAPFSGRGQALMSAAFCVAAALVHGRVSLAALEDVGDLRVLGLAARVAVEADSALPQLAARLEVAFEDGDSLRRQLVPDASTYGWSFAQVSDFCRDLRREMPAGGAGVEVLIDACARLETLPDVSALIQATIPRP